MDIEGPNQVTIPYSVSYQLNGRTRIPSCLDEDSITSSWSQIGEKTLDFSKILYQSNSLFLPANFMKEGEYELRYESCFKETGRCNNQDVTLIVIAEGFNFAISGFKISVFIY